MYLVALSFGDLYASRDALELIDFNRDSFGAAASMSADYRDYDDDDDDEERIRQPSSSAAPATAVLPPGSWKAAGEVVHCIPYGDGKVLSYDSTRGVYRIRLAFGELYAPEQTLMDSYNAGGKFRPSPKTMELNVAYEALETMRILNLEVTCQEIGVAFDPTRCTKCLIRSAEKAKSRKDNSMYAYYHRRPNPRKGTPCFICASPACKTHSCPKFRKEGTTVCDDCKHLFSFTDYAMNILTTSSTKDRNALLMRMFDTYDRTLLMLQYSSQFMAGVAADLEKNKRFKNSVGIGSSSVGLVSGSLGIAATACLLTPAAAVVAPGLIIASIFFGGTSSAMQTGVELGTNASEPSKVASKIIALYGMIKSILRTADLLGDVVTRWTTPDKVMLLDDFTVNHYTAERKFIQATAGTAAAKSESNSAVSVSSSEGDDNSLGKASAASGTRAADASGKRAPASPTKSKSTDLAVYDGSEAAGKNARFLTRSGANGVSMGSNAVSAGGNAISATAMTAAQFATFAGTLTFARADLIDVLVYYFEIETTSDVAFSFLFLLGGALSAAVLVCEVASMSSTIKDMRGGSRCPKADLLRKIMAEIQLLPDTDELERQCIAHADIFAQQRPEGLTVDEATQILIDLLGPEAAELEKKSTKSKQKGRGKNKELALGEVDGSTVGETYDCEAISEQSSITTAIEEEENESEVTSVLTSSTIDFADLGNKSDDENEKYAGFDLEDEKKQGDVAIATTEVVFDEGVVLDGEAAAADTETPAETTKKMSPRRGFWRGWSRLQEEEGSEPLA